MPRKAFTPVFLTLGLAALAATVLLVRHRRTPAPSLPPQPRTFPAAMPATVLWAWEEPEDLTPIDPTRTGVAYLAQSFTLTDHLAIRPRYQPLNLPPNTQVMAVVRIEAPVRIETPRKNPAAFHDTPALRTSTAQALAEVAHQPNLRALQIDFDATASQRPFYAAVLQQLRPLMPPGMPLSITALVSWCAEAPTPGSFLTSLPIDEAVPMFFRLGGHTKPRDSKLGYPIRQPLCRTSNGVSTDESWPTLAPTQRLYLFAPHPWSTAQLATLYHQQPLANRPTELTP